MSESSKGKMKVAVIEGGHPFDVINFHALFRSMPDVDFYPQTIDNWAADWGECRHLYDALVFYNMNQDFAEDGAVRTAIEEELGESDQGIVVLHHALLAYLKSEVWTELVGIQDRAFSYHVNQDFIVDVAHDAHPITHGLESWAMHDETYVMADAGPGCDVLLTTKYDKSMNTLAWTRTYRNARVFCLQLGHDKHAWKSTAFQEVLARGIRWTARRV